MYIELKDLRVLTLVSVSWQEKERGGLFIPMKSWHYVEGDTGLCSATRPVFQKFGYYVVRCYLHEYEVFEYVYSVHEELETVDVKYKKL